MDERLVERYSAQYQSARHPLYKVHRSILDALDKGELSWQLVQELDRQVRNFAEEKRTEAREVTKGSK